MVTPLRTCAKLRMVQCAVTGGSGSGPGLVQVVETVNVPVTAPISRAIHTNATLLDGMNAFTPFLNEWTSVHSCSPSTLTEIDPEIVPNRLSSVLSVTPAPMVKLADCVAS